MDQEVAHLIDVVDGWRLANARRARDQRNRSFDEIVLQCKLSTIRTFPFFSNQFLRSFVEESIEERRRKDKIRFHRSQSSVQSV